MHHLTTMIVASLGFAVAATATAQTAARAELPVATQKPAPAWPKAIAADRLDGQRGGADTVTTQASLNATVADNTARNVVTGNNVIDNGSFANMSGLPMVIQNTGANVLIQNATVINLQMR